MSIDQSSVNKILKELEKVKSIDHYARDIAPLSADEIKSLDQNGFSSGFGQQALEERLAYLKEKGIETSFISGKEHFAATESLKGNVENYIGMAMVPIGLAGPLLVKGTRALGDYFIPLATTEGALVASYSRGMKACRLSGGITSICLAEGIQRSPFFKFENIGQVGMFIKWVHEHSSKFGEIVKEVSRYAELNNIKTNVEGNSVILTFEFTTGDAAGQNMVTICSNHICEYILANFEITPKEWYIESNYAGDKKATVMSFTNIRGKKVTAEIVLLKEVIEKLLKTTPEKMARYWQSSTVSVLQSSSIGAQGHVANGLAALFIACGQDVACVAESSVGITRMEVTADGNLYVSVTLPALVVGTVGGGTGLPTQKECLTMLDCVGEGKARKFAEICCAVALSGEVSIAAAMSANHFTRAHQTLGRK